MINVPIEGICFEILKKKTTQPWFINFQIAGKY